MGVAQRGEFIHGMDDAESLELPIAEQVEAVMDCTRTVAPTAEVAAPKP